MPTPKVCLFSGLIHLTELLIRLSVHPAHIAFALLNEGAGESASAGLGQTHGPSSLFKSVIEEGLIHEETVIAGIFKRLWR